MMVNFEIRQAEYDVFLERVAAWHDDLTRELPGRITDTSLFRRSLVDAESGVGSPNSGRTAPIGAATEEDTRHCDMMVRLVSLRVWWSVRWPLTFALTRTDGLVAGALRVPCGVPPDCAVQQGGHCVPGV